MDNYTFGSIGVSDMDVIHDSARERFRSPLGAVPAGTEITLSLYIGDIYIEGASLCLLRDGNINRIPLEASDDMLAAKYIAYGGDGTGIVLWYWFEITLQGGCVCYYGADTGCNTGLGKIDRNPPPAFQITVYEPSFSTPDWAKGAILYQIFPDRFNCGNPEGVKAGIEAHRAAGRSEIELHESWDEIPVYAAKEGQRFYMPCDMFGGDLDGIRNRLPYLKSLGVSAVYLNPIFESASNHRYNTGDYTKVDPILGGVEALDRLVSEAKAAGIRIILDGVFSHTGDDSIYFNKYGRYDGLGAYQSTDSPYYEWYSFSEWPNKYASWWGFETLPEVREHNESWASFMIKNDDSVIKSWLRRGISGYRLDVADELPDDTIESIRSAVKTTDAEALLIGEVWEDATTKQHYGKNRKYALGLGLDTVTNYPFANMTADFLLGRLSAIGYRSFLMSQYLNYPRDMVFTLMNILSTHDIIRIRSRLSDAPDPSGLPREEQAKYMPTAEEDALGAKRQRLAAAIQFSIPGIPAVYYGDEVGMTGLGDPFNRMPYVVRDEEMLAYYKKLAEIHTVHPSMQRGDALYYSTHNNVFAVLRYLLSGDEEDTRDAVLTVVNRCGERRRIIFDFGQECEGVSLARLKEIRRLKDVRATSEFSGRTTEIAAGLLDISVEPFEADIFTLTWE